MLNNFVLMAQQILILFAIVILGFALGKAKFITEQGIKTCTNIVLYLATPCVIIKSFIREFSANAVGDLMVSFVISFAIHLVSIIVASLIFPLKKKDDRNVIFHYSTVFCNAGYMGLPLQAAILGDDGVFLCASYVAVFNIFVWTYGLWCMSKEKGGFSLRKLLNPGILSVIAGMIIFFTRIPVHSTIQSTLTHLGNLNTPLPMIIIGYYLSKTNLLSALKDRGIHLVTLVRLIVIPLVCLGLMYLLGIRGNMLVSMTICASAPVATATSMFAVLCGRDEELSVKAVSLTTILSVVTMSVIVALSQTLS